MVSRWPHGHKGIGCLLVEHCIYRIRGSSANPQGRIPAFRTGTRIRIDNCKSALRYPVLDCCYVRNGMGKFQNGFIGFRCLYPLKAVERFFTKHLVQGPNAVRPFGMPRRRDVLNAQFVGVKSGCHGRSA